MAGWRAQKRKALADIHETFEIPAVYLTHTAGTPVRANVRLHQRQIVDEQLLDDWAAAGKFLDLTNRIIFRASEVPAVASRSYVIFGNTEAYFTGASKPEREGYIWVEVTEVSKIDLSALLSTIDTSGPTWEGIVE